MSAWQPIETAPRDGIRVLICYHLWGRKEERLRVMIAEYDPCDEEWKSDWEGQIYTPTHWQPLPEPPTPEATRTN